MIFVTTRRALPSDLDWIKRMADRHRAELGFVRRPALAAAIERGEVLVALGGAGFVEFHRRRDGWATIYAIVSESPGSGRALLEAVPRPLRLKCPRDLNANGFYAHIGCVLARIEPAVPPRRDLCMWEWPVP